jgi:hypothetical protein
VNTDFGETTTAVEERAPAVRRVNRRLDALIPDKMTLFGLEINGHLPEKMAVKGLRLVKVQARREDVVGEVAKRTLRIFNGSFKTIARAATGWSRLPVRTHTARRRLVRNGPAAGQLTGALPERNEAKGRPMGRPFVFG